MLAKYLFSLSILAIMSLHADEERISLKEKSQDGLIIVESPTPLESITNDSEQDIYLMDEGVVLEKGEEHLFQGKTVFQAVVSIPKKAMGELVVSAKSLIPGQGYQKGENVSDETWEAVKPYLLPQNHPIKADLDKIFSEKRVTSTLESIKEAGFELTEGQGLHVIVVQHRDLKGYVVKMYPDYQVDVDDGEKWLARIHGANVIRNAIQKQGYKRLFKVPKKWIYPLPDNPASIEGDQYFRKNFILIAENVGLVSRKRNQKKWRSVTSKSLLKKIYRITEKNGMHDSLRISNLAWTKSGKLAFVDTESFNSWPVNHHPLVEFLSRKNRGYWKKLTSSARQL